MATTFFSVWPSSGAEYANLVYTLQPEKIVIVQGLAERSHWVLDTMTRTMNDTCWLLFRGFTKCEIVSSEFFGDMAGVLGAIRKAQLKIKGVPHHENQPFVHKRVCRSTLMSTRAN